MAWLQGSRRRIKFAQNSKTRIDPKARYRVGYYYGLTPKEDSMSQRKILVVDDEKHIRMLYREELEADGYAVATSDGEEDILDVISRENPTIVILDIKLGVNLSGLDLLQEIRTKDQQIPVILSTAYDSFQHDLKSIAADYYVVKSVDLTELKDKVRMALNKAGS
jgi:DNA-binding response OmpR family regulator